MNEKIEKLVKLIRQRVKNDILSRYSNIKYWDAEIIKNSMKAKCLSEAEKLEVITEIYGYDNNDTVFDLPRRIQIQFDLNKYYETERAYKCKWCDKKAKVYRVFDVDGRNLEESLVCLNCGDGTRQINRSEF